MNKPIVAANWKMFKTPEESIDFVAKLKKKTLDWDRVNLILFPPYTSLFEMGNSLQGNAHIGLGAQNFYWESEGAYTGEISIRMLKSCYVDWVIVGHSERRTIFAESDESVCLKAMTALNSGLSVIFCVGESLQERKANQTSTVLKHQLSELLSKLNDELLQNIVIAYEPIWAIGTGLNATSEQISEVHELVRKLVDETFPGASGDLSIQYGGSVNIGNCKELSEVSEIDGFLIGGASLDVDQFAGIAEIISEVKQR